MKLDRTIQPKVQRIDNINFQKAKKIILANKTPLYVINTGTQDVVNIDVFFNAGKRHQSVMLSALATSRLVTEGTSTMNSVNISEKLDFFGASININSYFDNACATIYSLTKHLPELLPLFVDIIRDPIFPEKEINLYLEKGKQNFDINNKIPKQIAGKRFNEAIFGSEHPYGDFLKKEYFDLVNRDTLIDFHSKRYNLNGAYIIVSGRVSEKEITLIQNSFEGQDWINDSSIETKNFDIRSKSEKKYFYEQKDSLQSAIRIGKLMINKTSKDIHKVEIVNTILGGYFGSRLMQKIREEKGYTYGISSFIMSLKDSGYFAITTQVHKDSCQNAIDDIYGEIKKLRTEKLSVQELESIKNYMLGDMLKLFDGPFNQADALDSIVEFGLDYNFYTSFFNEIKQITAETILETAEKYFHEDSMTEVVAGPRF